VVPRTHFEAHFYPDRSPRGLSQSTEAGNLLKAHCLHLAKGISIVKKQRERALSLPGKLPAPTNLREFFVEIGSGSPLPLIIAWCNGYLWTVLVRVRRQTDWWV